MLQIYYYALKMALNTIIINNSIVGGSFQTPPWCQYFTHKSAVLFTFLHPVATLFQSLQRFPFFIFTRKPTSFLCLSFPLWRTHALSLWRPASTQLSLLLSLSSGTRCSSLFAADSPHQQLRRNCLMVHEGSLYSDWIATRLQWSSYNSLC